MKSQLGHRSFPAPNTNQRHLFLHTAGTSHRHSKTCPNFSRMPLPQRTVVNLKNLQPLLRWSQQVNRKSGDARPCSGPSGAPPTGSTVEQLSHHYCALWIYLNRSPGLPTVPVCVCSLSLPTLGPNWHPVHH